MRTLICGTILSLGLGACAQAATVLVEAESFAERGGWVLDTQLMDTMGSPYLLAHGLGCPVADATTTVAFPETGQYRVFVRTKDWVARWNAPGAPGKFQLLIGGKPLGETFGTQGAEWFWHDGGPVEIDSSEVTLALRDLTGFEGRCDAIVLTNDSDFTPPNDIEALTAFRRKALGLPGEPGEAGEFDIVVIGGGPGGCCTAVTAARLGLKVALIQNRSILGGNNSSEVRVGVSGSTCLPPYPILGEVVNEWRPIGTWNFRRAREFPDEPGSKEILDVAENRPEQLIHNAAPRSKYQDDKKMAVVVAEKNLHLFLNMHAFKVEKHGNRITAVIAKHTQNAKESRFLAPLFVDCTGDGTIGYLAGADYEMTTKNTMGSTNMWRIAEVGEVSTFPRCPWTLDLTDKPFPYKRQYLGKWMWESGFNQDTIRDVEAIRDHNFRAMYGAWDCLKNVKNRYRNFRLVWAAYISGKRESRRLLGDVILTEQDVLQGKKFPDGCVAADWGMDLHYPDEKYAKGFEGREFISRSEQPSFKGPYTNETGRTKTHYLVPYRCLYSRNVDNLMMAGRDISVTHEVLGTVRVKGTIGMMGEVLGRAAYLCKKHNVGPRGVYEKHLDELKQLFNCSLAITADARTTVIAVDGFESYTTNTDLDGLDGGTGWSSMWNAPMSSPPSPSAYQVVAHPIDFTQGAVAMDGGDHAVKLDGSGGANAIDRRFSSAQSGTFYVSVLVSPANVGTGKGFHMFGISSEDAAHRGWLGFAIDTRGSVSGGDNSKGELVLRGYDFVGSQQSAILPDVFAADQGYLIVAKFSKSGATGYYDQIAVFLDPDGGTEPASLSLTMTGDGTGVSRFDTFRIREAVPPGELYFTNVAVGQTYADVVSIVPKPASAN